jgi:hypothetical protein
MFILIDINPVVKEFYNFMDGTFISPCTPMLGDIFFNFHYIS